MSPRVCIFVRSSSNADSKLPRHTAIKSILADDPSALQSLTPAFEKYNEEQFATVKLPGGSEEVYIKETDTEKI